MNEAKPLEKDSLNSRKAGGTYEYQRTGRYFVQVAGSLERLAKDELLELGAVIHSEVPRGFSISCDLAALYKIIYTSRLAQRVLAPLASFACHSEKYLARQSASILDWTSLFDVESSFGIDVNLSTSNIRHSLYAGQLLKDAICDQFRAKHGKRPDFRTSNPDINFNLHIKDNFAAISLDLSGSMHKRGYRAGTTDAPLQETLAAAIVSLSGWDGQKPLTDPMCGSGTLLCEALMSWCRIPAASLREHKYLTRFPDHDPKLWEHVKQQSDQAIRELPDGLISGSDLSASALQVARTSLDRLPFGGKVKLARSRFQDLPSLAERCVITNPPYGIRLEETASVGKLYNDLGDWLKQRCPGSEAYILCGSADLVPQLRLRAWWKKSLKNGDLDVKLAKILIR